MKWSFVFEEKGTTMKMICMIIVVLHAAIHLLGFVKSFGFATVSQLTQPITRIHGLLWLIAALLFLLCAVQLLLDNNTWWASALVAVIISQYLIWTSWQDAKFGTIANVLILLGVIVGYAAWNFEETYKKESTTLIQQAASLPDSLLSEADITPLPEPVKKYLRYVGVINKPMVKDFRIVFRGNIRKNEQSAWMPFSSEQYNSMGVPTRLFFMKASMMHLPVAGYHRFQNGNALMDIRLFSMFTVQYQSGAEMNIAETVTYFNDMCCMAPATLIDKRIRWIESTDSSARAEFTNNGITISATLFFNDKGELINFVSDDRYAYSDDKGMQKLRWSTPLKDYKEIRGYRLASYADAIYSYPAGDLCYGNFSMADIEYNLGER